MQLSGLQVLGNKLQSKVKRKPNKAITLVYKVQLRIKNKNSLR